MQTPKPLPVEITSLGACLPERVLSNADLSEMVETTDEWIFPRTGIRERRLLAPEQATSDLAIVAAEQALQQAGMNAADLDAILVATCSPDHLFPATACLVQAAIGATHAMACDLEAACSGFLYALAWGGAALTAGMVRNVLVIGAEALSRITDYEDRRSCILFGDGAGAAILQPSSQGSEILYAELGADGSWPEILMVPAGGSRLPASHETVDARQHYMFLKGRDVFRLAVGKLAELIQRIPEATGIGLDDVKLVIPHQSNVRIVKSAFERSGIDMSKAHMNIDRVGNTSAASIPLAMAEAAAAGEIERGDLVLLLAFGGGITWGSVLLRY
ncbi:MAG: ketoacyl-ACP synthase III [Candidatus Brocadiaceae bacterium]|nr:ketoacyl-ACP synthase III [Candidatus Brocadiaceae bacterium]